MIFCELMIVTATRSQKCNFKISMNGVRIQQTDNIAVYLQRKHDMTWLNDGAGNEAHAASTGLRL